MARPVAAHIRTCVQACMPLAVVGRSSPRQAGSAGCWLAAFEDELLPLKSLPYQLALPAVPRLRDPVRGSRRIDHRAPRGPVSGARITIPSGPDNSKDAVYTTGSNCGTRRLVV